MEEETDHYEERWTYGDAKQVVDDYDEPWFSGDNKFECKVCRRRFKSGNALGGHKRTHNNMIMVTATSNHHDLTTSSSHVPDRDRDTNGDGDAVITWSVTGKRGRKSTSSSGPSSTISSSADFVVPGMDQADKDAVIQLTLLALLGHKNSTTEMTRTTTPNPTPIQKGEEDDYEEGSNDGVLNNKTTTTTKVKSSLPAYECSVCLKPFKSYQALGGHKSRHNCSLPFDLNQPPPPL